MVGEAHSTDPELGRNAVSVHLRFHSKCFLEEV